MVSTAIELDKMHRIDAYPENTDYRDEGCELNPACLTCPLEVCRFDLPYGVQTLRTSTRMDQARDLRRHGRTVVQIGQELGISRRSVFRLLAR